MTYKNAMKGLCTNANGIQVICTRRINDEKENGKLQNIKIFEIA